MVFLNGIIVRMTAGIDLVRMQHTSCSVVMAGISPAMLYFSRSNHTGKYHC